MASKDSKLLTNKELHSHSDSASRVAKESESKYCWVKFLSHLLFFIGFIYFIVFLIQKNHNEKADAP